MNAVMVKIERPEPAGTFLPRNSFKLEFNLELPHHLYRATRLTLPRQRRTGVLHASDWARHIHRDHAAVTLIAIIGAGTTGCTGGTAPYLAWSGRLRARQDPDKDIKITLIEAADRIVPALPRRLSEATATRWR
jgi:hypothetical protein